AEWLACADPMPMLEFIKGKVSDRKLRLFAVACCRRVWEYIADERGRRAVELSERFAEGGVAPDELRLAFAAAFHLAINTVFGRGSKRRHDQFLLAASSSANPIASDAAASTSHDLLWQIERTHRRRAEQRSQVEHIRCLTGN